MKFICLTGILAGGKNKGFDHAYFTTINNYPREFVMIFKSFTKRKFRNIELYNKNGGTVVRVNANFAFIWFNNTFMIKSLPSDYYLLNNSFTCFFKQLDLFKVIANSFFPSQMHWK